MAHAPRRTERAGVGRPIDGSDSAPAGIAAFAVLLLCPDTKIYQQDEVRDGSPMPVSDSEMPETERRLHLSF
jgi:hypothetical protein